MQGKQKGRELFDYYDSQKGLVDRIVKRVDRNLVDRIVKNVERA